MWQKTVKTRFSFFFIVRTNCKVRQCWLRKIFIDDFFFQADQWKCTSSPSFNQFSSSIKNVPCHEVHRLSVSSSFIYRFISALFLIKLTVLLLKTWVNLLALLTPFKLIGILKSVRCYCTSMFSRILGAIMNHVQSQSTMVNNRDIKRQHFFRQ